MKKLKLKLDDVKVTSFEAGSVEGSIHGMEGVRTPMFCGASGYLTCECSAEPGCYPSKWCTGPGCVATANQPCETADNSPC